MVNGAVYINKESFVNYYIMLGKKNPKDFNFDDLMVILRSGNIREFPYKVVKPIKDILEEIYIYNVNGLSGKTQKTKLKKKFVDGTKGEFFEHRYELNIDLKYNIKGVDPHKIEDYYKYLIEEESRELSDEEDIKKAKRTMSEYRVGHLITLLLEDCIYTYRAMDWYLGKEKAKDYIGKYIDMVKTKELYGEEGLRISEKSWDKILRGIQEDKITRNKYMEKRRVYSLY